jgi:hypothetical protein
MRWVYRLMNIIIQYNKVCDRVNLQEKISIFDVNSVNGYTNNWIIGRLSWIFYACLSQLNGQ